MQKEIIIIIFISGFLGNICSVCGAQQRIQYKQVDTTALFFEMYQPENLDTSKAYPALVYFFGGGWVGGSLDQFRPHAQYFSQRGMVCFLVEYRVKNRHQTSPFESLKDAKSAFRFIRNHANDLKIDPDKIVASGGSAGGHLAAALATISGYNEDTDDQAISCIPNALVLYNPVIDNGPGGYGYERIQDQYKAFSPLHNLNAGAPPTIIFLGTNDRLVPVETAEYYKIVMEKVQSRCDLFLYDKQKHGFFNYKNLEYYIKTVSETDKFLKSIGYLEDTPVIEIK
jgi:acetyl esterase/lipase